MFVFAVVLDAPTVETDCVVIHVGTNHLDDIIEDIRELEPTLEQHVQLVAATREKFPSVPVLVSKLLPRFDGDERSEAVNIYNYRLSHRLSTLEPD